jgi:hypothetical protein
MGTGKLVKDRAKTHGDFYKTSELATRLADATAPALSRGTQEHHVLRHAREMICVKLARITKGDSGAAEHWEDIAGYAALVAEHLSNRG